MQDWLLPVVAIYNKTIPGFCQQDIETEVEYIKHSVSCFTSSNNSIDLTGDLTNLFMISVCNSTVTYALHHAIAYFSMVQDVPR